MKIFKIIGFTMIGIISLSLIVVAFAKKDHPLERCILIHKPSSEVFEYIKYLKSQLGSACVNNS